MTSSLKSVFPITRKLRMEKVVPSGWDSALAVPLRTTDTSTRKSQIMEISNHRTVSATKQPAFFSRKF
jgi:hypothetical protein